MHDRRDDLVPKPLPDDLAARASDHDVERERPATEIEVQGTLGPVLDAKDDRNGLADPDARRHDELERERVIGGFDQVAQRR
jgi:hypothetical protein